MALRLPEQGLPAPFLRGGLCGKGAGAGAPTDKAGVQFLEVQGVAGKAGVAPGRCALSRVVAGRKMDERAMAPKD